MLSLMEFIQNVQSPTASLQKGKNPPIQQVL